jgi:heme exporter protein A
VARPLPTPLAIDLQQIARRFGHRWALRGITLQVAPGEVIGVMGHNGSGKSTLLRVIATALSPTRGDGTVFGFQLRRDAQEIREVVGFLAHAPGVYEDLSARENLVFASRMRGDPNPRPAVDAALAYVGLARVADERVRGFSSGMQRRVALARLILQRPRLLLLDEPYNSFDTEGVTLVNRLVSETREAGGAAVIVAHDLARGDRLMDRVDEMEAGVMMTAPRLAVSGAD